MSSELISVIVPVYNVEEYLRECLDSIINQTYTNLEIILVDDGSTDKSGKICDEYQLKDNRIHVVHKKNGGLSDARNAGLDICRGEYIGFVDSDDYISPNMYHVLYYDIKEYNADISVCGAVVRRENLEKKYFTNDNIKYLEDKNKIIESIFCPISPISPISACIKLYKREIFSGLRFAVGKVPEDAMIIMDIIEKASSMVFTEKYLYYYRTRENSITHKKRWTYIIQGLIEAYENNYHIIKNKYPKMLPAAEYRLWMAYRLSLFLASECVEYREHRDEVNKIRIKILKDIPKMFFHKYHDYKKFFACIVVMVSPLLYRKIREVV